MECGSPADERGPGECPAVRPAREAGHAVPGAVRYAGPPPGTDTGALGHQWLPAQSRIPSQRYVTASECSARERPSGRAEPAGTACAACATLCAAPREGGGPCASGDGPHLHKGAGEAGAGGRQSRPRRADGRLPLYRAPDISSASSPTGTEPAICWRAVSWQPWTPPDKSLPTTHRQRRYLLGDGDLVAAGIPVMHPPRAARDGSALSRTGAGEAIAGYENPGRAADPAVPVRLWMNRV